MAQRRRRRPNLSTIATYAVAAYGTYRLGQYVYEQWFKEEENDDMAGTSPASASNQMRRQPLSPHQERLKAQIQSQCQRDVIETLHALGNTLKRKLEALTDFTHAKQALKELRASKNTINDGNDSIMDEKRRLWKVIQVETVTRVLGTPYAHCLLFCVLVVQVNVIAGQSFYAHDESNFTNNSDLQTILLQTYSSILDRGLGNLLDRMRTIVTRELDQPEWDMMDPVSSLHMSFDKLMTTVTKCRQTMDESVQDGTIFAEFVVVPSTNNGEKESHCLLLDETLDLLESPLAREAVGNCLFVSFERLTATWQQNLFHDDSSRTLVDHQPLPRVITKLKNTVNGFYESDSIYLATMKDLNCVHELSVACFQ